MTESLGVTCCEQYSVIAVPCTSSHLQVVVFNSGQHAVHVQAVGIKFKGNGLLQCTTFPPWLEVSVISRMGEHGFMIPLLKSIKAFLHKFMSA